MTNSKLVYSTDPKDQKKMNDELEKLKREKSGESIGAGDLVKSRNFTAIFRIEKGGRGGKTVTVIDGLPKQELFLKELTKTLKNKCGTGGTYSLEGKEGIVEIQGDKRDVIKKIFDSMNIKYKGM